MENRFQHTFLRVCLSLIILAPAIALADNDQRALDTITSPDIERRTIKESDIDSEDFEFGVFAGVLSLEDFGSNTVTGIRFAYHVSEDIFLEANYGVSQAEKTSAETISGTVILTEEERDLSYYNLTLGYNIFPGQVNFWGNRAYNTRFYLAAGVGNTDFASDSFLTYNFGGGFEFFPTDYLAIHLNVKNHLFSHSLFIEEKSIQNMETHLGLSFFF